MESETSTTLSSVNFDDLVFIDIQGFKIPQNRFMVKEFCIINEGDVFHAVVKHNYSFRFLPSFYQRQAIWLTRCFHGLLYESGNITIDEVRAIVYPKIKDKIIMVKGCEKAKWLQYIFRKFGEIDILNIEDCNFQMDCSGEYIPCDNHQKLCYNFKKCHCALSNAKLMKDISLFNLKQE